MNKLKNRLFKNLILLLNFILFTSFTIEKEKVKSEEWKLIAENVEATVYNALPGQGWGDCSQTASSFKLNLKDVYSHKIIAIEKTFMKNLGLKFGDVVKIEGTGKWDGIWQIQDTMGARHKGKKKIDFLVPNNIKSGKWNTVKMYCLSDKNKTHIYINKMAPESSIKKK